MGESRKRKSLWDKEAETKPVPGKSDNNTWTGKDQHPSRDSEHNNENPASRSHGATKFRDHYGQPSPESIENDPVTQMNGSFTKSRERAPEGKEIGGENSNYQNMPPNFKYNQDRTHSRRYPGRGRGRSRSRTRTRTRGRCRSRSLSGDKERERMRGRSRSRSRSRSDGNARGQTGSRSPLGDLKHQSSGRRSHPEKLTEICSDFAAGRCRRGSQCKYLHPKDTGHRDGGADTSENWRSKADHGNDSKHSYGRGPQSELKGGFSDSYHAEDEQLQNKSKNAVPCKNFVKGKCRWTDACKFSHHFASVGGTKHLSSDKDTEHQSNRNRKLLCKYFAAGKCDRDNCRFSHKDSKFNSLEGRHGKAIDDHGCRDKSNRRNDSIWGDPGSSVDNSNTGHDNRWSNSLGNENINWGLPQQTDILVDKNKEPVSRSGSGSYGGELGTTESVSKELQVQDRSLNVGQNKFPVDQKLFVNAWQQNISPASRIQQPNHGVVEITSFHSDIIDEVKGSPRAAGPVLVPGQNMHQNGDNILPGNSCISEEVVAEQTPEMIGSEIPQVANVNLQSLVQKHQNAIQMSGISDTSQSTLVTSEPSAQYTSGPLSISLHQVDPVTNPVVYPNQRFENENSGKYAVAEVSDPKGMAISISNASGHVPFDSTANIKFNPVGVSNDQLNSMENGGSNNEKGNHAAEGNKMPAGRLSPSTVGMGSDNSEVDNSGRSKLQQEAAPENPEFDEAKRGIVEQSKGVENSMQTLDGHGKGEEVIANKDDKEMRLFKNSLIEFVKDILKPTWKEGQMSREVHKTIVKKVVDKIMSTIQMDHIPKTQEKVEQYLSFSKLKIAKLVQAYVDRCLKPDS